MVFGKSGWIGGLVGDLLKEQGAKFEYASCRLEDRSAVIAGDDIDMIRKVLHGRMADLMLSPFHLMNRD